MAQNPTIEIDQIDVTANGCVQIREKVTVLNKDAPPSVTLSRRVIAPGADYSREASEVKSVCAATHTPEVIAAYRAALTAI